MKFLIIKTSSLGDILQSFPVATYLRAKFPDSQIDWVVEEEFSELVRANPEISHVLTVKTRQWRRGKSVKELFAFRSRLRSTSYDAIFDLQGNVKSGLILFLAKGHHKIGFGKTTVPEKPNLLFTTHQYNPPKGKNIREDYLYLVQTYFSDDVPFQAKAVELVTTPEVKERVKAIISSLGGNKKVLVCPGSAWINKQLTREQLIGFLKKQTDCKFLFGWGSPAEKEFSQQLSQEFPGSILLEKLPLPALQNLMGKMDLVVSMDSLPLHLAGTTEVKTYSFFGPSLALKYCPQGPQHQYSQGTCPYGRTFEKRCPILRSCPTGACLREPIIS
jgi:heptosyltransferase-1